MNVDCLKFLNELSEEITIVNLELVDKMTNEKTNYDTVCIKTDVTYDYYFDNLKKKFNKGINEYLNKNKDCNITLKKINRIYDYIKIMSENIDEENYNKIKLTLRKLINFYEDNKVYPKNLNDEKLNSIKSLLNKNINQDIVKKIKNLIFDEDFIYDYVAKYIKSHYEEINFELKKNVYENLYVFGELIFNKCSCHLYYILESILQMYKIKYSNVFKNKSESEIKFLLKEKVDYVKDLIKNTYGNLSNINESLHKDIKSLNGGEMFINPNIYLDKLDNKNNLIDIIKKIKNDLLKIFSEVYGISAKSRIRKINTK